MLKLIKRFIAGVVKDELAKEASGGEKRKAQMLMIEVCRELIYELFSEGNGELKFVGKYEDARLLREGVECAFGKNIYDRVTEILPAEINRQISGEDFIDGLVKRIRNKQL